MGQIKCYNIDFIFLLFKLNGTASLVPFANETKGPLLVVFKWNVLLILSFFFIRITFISEVFSPTGKNIFLEEY